MIFRSTESSHAEYLLKLICQKQLQQQQGQQNFVHRHPKKIGL